MQPIIANWRTGLLGLAACLTALGHLISGIAHGDWSSVATDGPVILAGLTGIFAKDAHLG